VSFARSEIAEAFACLGVCCSGSSTGSSSFAASASSTSARRKYISRVSGFLVFEACRLRRSQRPRPGQIQGPEAHRHSQICANCAREGWGRRTSPAGLVSAEPAFIGASRYSLLNAEAPDGSAPRRSSGPAVEYRNVLYVIYPGLGRPSPILGARSERAPLAE
jgi:hypothetical protein